MKTTTIKGLLLAFLCTLSFNFIVAQDVEGDEPHPNSTITVDPTIAQEFLPTAVTPTIKSSSVIFYSDGISLKLEFNNDGTAPLNALFVDQSNTSNVLNLPLSGGQTQLFGVAPGRVYDIKATGSDGQLYIVGSVNTAPYVAGDPIAVSEELYRALSSYVTVESQGVTLSTYLKQLPNISQHENIAFFQKYFMNGAVLPASIKGQYPDSYVNEALTKRGVEGECICNFVMNQVTVVVPDETGNNDFSIGAKTVTSGPTHYNNSSFWFRGATSEGAAKKYRLFNAGHTAGNKKRTETWTSGGDNISDNFVRIGYHLMCVGIAQLPSACDCEKQVKFDFGYSTRTEARTNTGGFGCIFNQDAAARSQDWAVAVATREKVNSVNDVQVFGSGLSIATSKCSGGVPVSVLVDAAKIGVSVFQLIKSVKTAQLNDIVNQTNQIIDKVGAVLEKITETKDCNSALIEKPLLQGTAVITFRPNDPLSFMIMSGSSLEVMGLRCWESDAKINSGFHLAGVVTGGAPSLAPHCCTGYFANWAYASQNGDASNRRNMINGHLALNSPGGWQTVNGAPNPGGGINVTTEVGYAIGVNLPDGQRCNKHIPIFNNPN